MADGNDVQICHTCGSSCWADFIVACKKCERVSTHLYCTKRVLDGISEQWYCEDCTDCEQATNGLNGKAPLHNPTDNIAQFASLQLNKTSPPPQTAMSNSDENLVSNLNDNTVSNLDDQPASRRGKRSTAKCLNILKRIAAGYKLEMKFNEEGAPIGDDARKFTSFCAAKTRDMIPCSYVRWKQVPKELKEDLYQAIAEMWNLPPNCPHMQKILTHCCNKWRAWKCRLNKKYRLNAQDGASKPWDAYNISKEEWDTFDGYCQTTEFVELSKKGHENALKKDMPHTLGSGGYLTSYKRWKEGEVVHGATSAISQEVDKRAYRWSRARATKDPETGELRVQNPKACEVLDKAVALAKSGEIEAVRQNDILTFAIGTPEHSGRLRGYPIFSGVKQVYGKGTRKSKGYTKEEFDRRVQEEVDKRVQEEVGKVIDAKLQEEVDKQVQATLTH